MLADTNILVSALLFNGNERRSLRAVSEGRLVLVVPEHVAREAREVLGRFATRPELAKAKRSFHLTVLASETVPDEAAQKFLVEAQALIRDRSDAPVLAAALASRPDVLVTGDKDFHAIADQLPFDVLTTREVLKRYGLG